MRGSRRAKSGVVAGLAVVCALGGTVASARPSHHTHKAQDTGSKPEQASRSATPIKHLVVLFQENQSFDHYFGTYPAATNPPGEPQFQAREGTPSVNGLNENLLSDNPNGVNPRRFDPGPHNSNLADLLTCDQNHDYKPEQQAFDRGLMDKFPQFTGTATGKDPQGQPCNPAQVMDYYDGNTVTALWNYAQRYALSDNSFDTTFGPSTPGALNLISGQTNPATPANIPDSVANGSVIGDPDPTSDDCSGTTKAELADSSKNVGDLLNNKGVSWGFFQGGFAPTSVVNGKALCGSTHTNIGGHVVTDYSPHHEPFQYYPHTSNPHHLPPASDAEIGHSGQANHQYDLSLFYRAIQHGNLPAVSYVKAAKYQDGHPGYSDPIDEQHFLVNTINQIQQSKYWKSTAIVIAYDDSDGWYDHVMSPIVNQSQDPAYDALGGDQLCGLKKPAAKQDRCGYGPRMPLLIISPFAKRNYVDHSITDVTSVLRFVEDNWHTGRNPDQTAFDHRAGTLEQMFNFDRADNGQRLILDPNTGQSASDSN